jgi:hypothetical protein
MAWNNQLDTVGGLSYSKFLPNGGQESPSAMKGVVSALSIWADGRPEVVGSSFESGLEGAEFRNS